MINRIKHKILQWLTNDISKRLVEKRGYAYLGDMRACAQIEYLGMEAWGLGKWYEEAEYE